MQRTNCCSFFCWFLLVISLTVAGLAEEPRLTDQPQTGFEWIELRHIERTSDGFRTIDHDPWLISRPFDVPISPDRRYLLISMRTSVPVNVEIRWWNRGESLTSERTARFASPGQFQSSTRVLDLANLGEFTGLQAIRLDPGNDAGTTFHVDRLECLTLDQIPAEHVPDLINLRCFTSKLHYLPGEAIRYQLRLAAENFPDRDSSKLAEIQIVNQRGKTVLTDWQHFGVLPGYRIRELTGMVNANGSLPPGPYTLSATVVDQRTNLRLQGAARFGIQDIDDPFVLETPFKFVKDFSIIRDRDGIWHLFSITGELAAGHDWMLSGQERTFSHSSSADLRHWTYHRPVLSVTNDLYPDGKEHYQNRNIWAPHVIRRDGTYFMFYTSVNDHVSQSISLATSPDLEHWTPHPRNPVFTLENLTWADWARDRWADCRDPMVLEDDGHYYLYVTAHAAEGSPRGLVAVADSTNLIDWKNPRIALRHQHACESPQVWKQNGNYFMTTSAAGSGTWTSRFPDRGWQPAEFPRPPVREMEKYVQTSPSYAEETVELDEDQRIIASLTFRYWGNSIYFFCIQHNDQGVPVGYESPWEAADSPRGR
jgi:hypothetical protein